jgi:hypothetical protein
LIYTIGVGDIRVACGETPAFTVLDLDQLYKSPGTWCGQGLARQAPRVVDYARAPE